MLTRHRLAQPEAAASSALKANAALQQQQPVSQRLTRAALGVRDTNLLVELAAPLSLGGFSSAPLKQTTIPSRASSRSSKLAKLSSRVANLVAVVAAESEAAKENPRSLTQQLENAESPQQPQQQQSQQEQQDQGKENAENAEDEDAEDATDRAWIEMNKQVTPMKKKQKQKQQQPRKSVAVASSSSARKSLAPSSSAASVHYTDLHTSVLNDLEPTPFTSHALSLTPTPAATSSTSARRSSSNRRRRSSTQGGALKFAVAGAAVDVASFAPVVEQAAEFAFAPVSLLATVDGGAEEFGAAIPDEPTSAFSGSENDADALPSARAVPTACFTPTSYARSRKSMAAASSRSPHRAFASRKSDRRSLHHTQLQLLKQLVAEDQQAEQQMQEQQQQQQQQQREESAGVAIGSAMEPTVVEPVARLAAVAEISPPVPIESEVQPPGSAAAAAVAVAPASVDVSPLTAAAAAVIPSPPSAAAESAVSSATHSEEAPAEIAPLSDPAPACPAPEAVAVARAVRVSPKRFASSARKARSVAPTTPSASAAAAAVGPSRRAPATAARKSLFDASMRDEDAAASLFSSGLMRLTFHAGTPPATPIGHSKAPASSREAVNSARRSIAQDAEPISAEAAASTPPTPAVQSKSLAQITGRSPARRRSLQAREHEAEIDEPAIIVGEAAPVSAEAVRVAEAEPIAPSVEFAALEADAVDIDAEQLQAQVDAPQLLSTPVRSRRGSPTNQHTPAVAAAAAAAAAVASTPARSPLRSVAKLQTAATSAAAPEPQAQTPSPARSPVRATRSSPVCAVAAATPSCSSQVDPQAATPSPQSLPTPDLVLVDQPSAESSPVKQALAVRVSPKRFASSARKARSVAPTTPSASAAASGASRRAPATAARKSLFDASMRDEDAAASLFSSGLMRLTFHAGTPPATPVGLSKAPASSPEAVNSARRSIAQDAELGATEAAASTPPTPAAQSKSLMQITGRSPARRRSLQAREHEMEEQEVEAPVIVEAAPVAVEEAASAPSPVRRSPLRSAAAAANHSPAAPTTPVRSPVRSAVRSSPRSPACDVASSATSDSAEALCQSPAQHPAFSPSASAATSPDVSPSKHSRKSLLRVVATRFARRGAQAEIPDAILQRLFTATKDSVSPVQLSPAQSSRSFSSSSSSSSSTAASSREHTPEKQLVRAVRSSPQKWHMNTPVPAATNADAVATPLSPTAVTAASPQSPSPLQSSPESTPAPSPQQKAAARRRSKRSPVAAVARAAPSAIEPAAAAVTLAPKAAEEQALAIAMEPPSVLSFVRSHPIQCAAVVGSFMSAAAALCYLL